MTHVYKCKAFKATTGTKAQPRDELKLFSIV